MNFCAYTISMRRRVPTFDLMSFKTRHGPYLATYPSTRNQDAKRLRRRHGKHLVVHEQQRMHPNPRGGSGAQRDGQGGLLTAA